MKIWKFSMSILRQGYTIGSPVVSRVDTYFTTKPSYHRMLDANGMGEIGSSRELDLALHRLQRCEDTYAEEYLPCNEDYIFKLSLGEIEVRSGG